MISLKDIKSVKKISYEPTFDINVPYPHLYKLDSGLVVHNTISLVAGSVSPGAHFPIKDGYYIRRVRISKNSDLIPILAEYGYPIEDTCYDSTSVCVEIPKECRIQGLRSDSLVSVEEKFEMLRLIQRYWSDNQVSFTLGFDPETEGHKLKDLIIKYAKDLKSISFLPNSSITYPQMPYESITKEQYLMKKNNIRDIPDHVLVGISESKQELDNMCDSENCTRN